MRLADLTGGPLELAGPGLVRVPLLPVAQALRPGRLAADVRRVLAGESRSTVANLVAAAVLLTSPSLARALESRRGREERARDALARVVRRMALRTTPFGPFAGVALLGAPAPAALEWSLPRSRVFVRPDAGAVRARLERIHASPAEKTLRFRACDLTRKVGHRLYAPSGARSLSIRCTRPVDLVLRAVATPISRDELVQRVIHGTGAGSAVAGQLVDELIGGGWLVPCLGWPQEVADPAAHLARLLSASGSGACAELARVLESFPDGPFELAELLTAGRARKVTALGLGVTGGETQVSGAGPGLAVEVVLDVRRASLPRTVLAEAARAARLLCALSPSGEARAVLEFRERFANRYGAHRPVPVLEALSPDQGVGLLGPEPSDRVQRLDEVELARLLARALRDDATVLDVSGIELSEDAPSPDSVDLSFQIDARSPGAIDRGQFRLVVSPMPGHCPGGRMNARFAHLIGGELTASLRHTLDRTVGDGAETVEVYYEASDARLANVTGRPPIGRHILDWGRRATSASENLLSPSDLVFVLDQSGLTVRHARSFKRLVLVASTMLNPAFAPPAVSTLLALGRGAAPRLRPFSWAGFENLPFVPRVVVGRIVLRVAEWKLFGEAGWREISRRKGTPRFVELVEGDERLTLDLESREEAAWLRRRIGKAGASRPVVVAEALPDPRATWARSSTGGHRAEIVLTFARRTPPARTTEPAPRRPVVVDDVQRIFVPGTAWTCIHAYLPQAAMRDILRRVLPVVGSGAQRGEYDRWHYLAYRDEQGSHLRVRVRKAAGTGAVDQGLVELFGRLVDEGAIGHFRIDSYDRELERYGGARAHEEVELFWTTESAQLHELAIARPVPGGGALESACARSVAALLHGFLGGTGVSPWLRDFAPRGMRLQLDRVDRESLIQAVRLGQGVGAESGPLARLRAAASVLGSWLRGAGDTLTRPPEAILRCLIHMHVNRWLALESGGERRILGAIRDAINAPA